MEKKKRRKKAIMCLAMPGVIMWVARKKREKRKGSLQKERNHTNTIQITGYLYSYITVEEN